MLAVRPECGPGGSLSALQNRPFFTSLSAAESGGQLGDVVRRQGSMKARNPMVGCGPPRAWVPLSAGDGLRLGFADGGRPPWA